MALDIPEDDPLVRDFAASLKYPTAGLRELDRLDFEQDHLRFMKKFFPLQDGSEFRIGRHHPILAWTLDNVLAGRIRRLIINIPPGYTKTQFVSVHFPARGFAINPRSRFISTSSSDELVMDNSVKVKDILRHEEYQMHWQRSFRRDQNTKGLWRTANGGGYLAKPAGGAIIGFRAGTMDPGFTGALLIDDPIKADDIYSQIKREHINSRWHSTFKSRLAKEDVPVIVIMQRLHVDDFTGFLLRGGAHCKWHHLMLPIVIDGRRDYPIEYTHGIPIHHGLSDGLLWPEKHSLADVEILKADGITFAGQYMQEPVRLGGNLFQDTYFIRYHEVPPLAYRAIYVDTAQKIKEMNDYTVFQVWGATPHKRAVLIDQVRGRFEAPELLKVATSLWDKHRDTTAYPISHFGNVRGFRVEDKVSGTGLIQSLRRESVPVGEVGERHKDKYLRAMDVIPSCASGLVMIPYPANAPWIIDWLQELLAFPNGQHDDQVDPTVDAIREIALQGSSMLDVVG